MRNGVVINGVEHRVVTTSQPVWDACKICSLKRRCTGGTMYCNLFNKVGYISYFVKSK